MMIPDPGTGPRDGPGPPGLKKWVPRGPRTRRYSEIKLENPQRFNLRSAPRKQCRVANIPDVSDVESRHGWRFAFEKG